MSTNATPNIFGVEELSRRFGVRPLEIQRVIARGRLNAGRVRPGAPWMVSDSAVQKFVNSGMSDLVASHLTENGLAAEDERTALGFSTAVEKAVEAAGLLMDEAQMQGVAIKELTRPHGCTSKEFTLDVSPQITALLGKPVPASPLPGAKPSRYERWSHCYLVEQLWRALPEVIRRRNPGKLVEVMPDLYAGPTEFREITAAAFEIMKSREIIFSRRMYVVVPDRVGTTMFTVYYRLPHEKIISAFPTFENKASLLIDLAF